MFGNKDIMVSDDITLCHLIPLDAQDIFDTIDSQRQYLSQWLPFVPHTISIKDTEDFINFTLNNKLRTEKVFTIQYQNTFVGLIGYKDIDDANNKTEIGYWLSQHYQGKGIMTQCVNKLCDYAFNSLTINRIQIKCAVGNIPSSNIPKRLHFKLEGIERQGEKLSSGVYADLEVYSLLKQDYIE